MLAWMLLPHLVLADPPGDWFEFALPPLDAGATYLDLSYLNPVPAGEAGFIRVDGARFADGAGERIRFFGSNLTFGAAFPAKPLAEQLAARLRKLGVNVIRLHHLDNQRAPRGIWADNAAGTFDPEQLDRLCHLIHQLKQHGIYTNLNLHVSRDYPGIDYDAIPRAFRYGKIIDHSHPRLIALQKQYATDLLTHRNPYTGLRLADEPAMAMVELNNENTLLGAADNSDLLALPEELRAPLEAGWRAWVAARYGNLQQASGAWLAGVEPLGDELLTNRDFAAGTDRWTLEAPAPAEATMTAADGVLRAVLTQPGREAWHFQLHQTSLDLTDGMTYTVAFRARADERRPIRVNVRIDQADWHMCGLDVPVELSPDWRDYRYVFTASRTVPNHCRLSFTLGNVPGAVELAEISFRRGADLALPAGTNLTNLPMPIGAGFRPLRLDWLAYLAETEQNYVAELTAHLRGLGVRAPIIDTQASYAGLGGIVRETDLSDYIDMHTYWHHPVFPGTPWHSRNWYVTNSPLTAAPDGGTMPRLASYRVDGRPFTVSEYDHPAPQHHTGEMFPILAAVAAVQDWDGLFQFNWGSSEDNLTADRITGFFNLATHPAKLATMPLAALLFRGGLVPAAADAAVLELPRDQVGELMADGLDSPRLWQQLGAAPGLFARRRMAVRLTDGGEPRLLGAGPAPAAGVLSDQPPLRWSTDPGLVLIEAEQVAVAVGALPGRRVEVGPLTVELDATPLGHATVGLISLDGAPLSRSRRLLLTAVGAAINTGMGWNEAFTSVTNQWGTAPMRLESLRGTITLQTEQTALTVTPLDGTGALTEAIESRVAGGRLRFEVGPGAVWWGVQAVE